MCVVAFVLLLIGVTYEQLMRTRALKDPIGDLAVVNGQKMHYVVQGSGAPTVVFEAALGEPGTISGFQKHVVPRLVDSARILCYDRAGLGWSEPSTIASRTSEQISDELYLLLKECGEEGPFILVAHSVGGFHVRVFAELHPELVAGMVLLDCSHPEQKERLPNGAVELPAWWMKRAYQFAGNTGILRLATGNEAGGSALLPGSLNAVGGEINAIDESANQVLKTNGIGDKPLVVVSAGKPPDHMPKEIAQKAKPVWIGLQRELSELSSNSKQLVDERSGHGVPNDIPEVVTRAILEVIDAANNNSELGQLDGKS